MSSVPFHYLDLRAFSYETEDEARVAAALQTLLPDGTELDRDETDGHHGDRIVVLSTRLERSRDVREVLQEIQNAPSFRTVVDELADRVDGDGAFFVRFDKQQAFRGEIALGPGIQLRGKIEAYPASRQNAIENLQSYFSGVQ